jgi:hypothetical protein
MTMYGVGKEKGDNQRCGRYHLIAIGPEMAKKMKRERK